MTLLAEAPKPALNVYRMSQAASESYERYRRIGVAITERYRMRIFNADPRVGMDMAFHLSHNWGNDASKVLLARYRAVCSWLYKRSEREYWQLVHRDEHRSARAGWCRLCKGNR